MKTKTNGNYCKFTNDRYYENRERVRSYIEKKARKLEPYLIKEIVHDLKLNKKTVKGHIAAILKEQ